MISVFKSIALLVVIAFGAASCSEAEQKGVAKKKKNQVVGDDAADDDDDDDDDDDGGSNGGGDDDGGTTASSDEVFQLWCDRAIEIPRVKEHHQEFYDRLCKGGKPTKLFTSTLINDAYKGSGEPDTKLLEDYKHDSAAKTTEAHIGVALQIPIDIETHFNEVGPRQGNKESLTKLAEKQGATPASIKIDIQETYEDDGKYHVRGWKVHSESSKTILIITLKTDTLIRADQYELEKGKAYLYAQYMIDGKDGILDYDQLVAGIQVGDKSYLITVARVVAENSGFTSTAEQEIPKNAQILAKNNYEAAEDAQ